jgi:hypothetical protein
MAADGGAVLGDFNALATLLAVAANQPVARVIGGVGARISADAADGRSIAIGLVQTLAAKGTVRLRFVVDPSTKPARDRGYHSGVRRKVLREKVTAYYSIFKA